MSSPYRVESISATPLHHLELGEVIRERIAASGPLPFEAFMELALYHPDYGYYTRSSPSRTGTEGDFITNVSVGPLFGFLLARQFQQMWEVLEQPEVFWIIEQGAHDGQLAYDILTACACDSHGSSLFSPAFCQSIRYGILEPFCLNRQRQEQRLSSPELASRVVWWSSAQEMELEKSEGVFFSNELVDSFPVALLLRQAGQWYERYVTFEGEVFCFCDRPLDQESELNRVLSTLPLAHGDCYPEGYQAEINLQARRWMKEKAALFKRGFFLTIDYGFTQSALYDPARTSGTLQGYCQHQRSSSPLEQVGCQDLTTHVDFTALAQSGEEMGLKTEAWVDQHHWMVGLCAKDLAQNRLELLSSGWPTEKAMRQWKALMHPELLGQSFYLLFQTKGSASLHSLVESWPFTKKGLF